MRITSVFKLLCIVGVLSFVNQYISFFMAILLAGAVALLLFKILPICKMYIEKRISAYKKRRDMERKRKIAEEKKRQEEERKKKEEEKALEEEKKRRLEDALRLKSEFEELMKVAKEYAKENEDYEYGIGYATFSFEGIEGMRKREQDKKEAIKLYAKYGSFGVHTDENGEKIEVIDWQMREAMERGWYFEERNLPISDKRIIRGEKHAEKERKNFYERFKFSEDEIKRRESEIRRLRGSYIESVLMQDEIKKQREQYEREKQINYRSNQKRISDREKDNDDLFAGVFDCSGRKTSTRN